MSNTKVINADINNIDKSNKKRENKNELICVMLKITNNFLIKITEKNIVEQIKKEITELGIKKFIEIDDEKIDTNSLLFEFIDK